MPGRRNVTPRSAAKTYGSDFAKSDAHQITSEEYAEIPELTDEMLSRAVPGNGEDILRRGRGRPKIDSPKRQVSIRLDADVLAGIKATGAGWHGRVNEALREWLNARGRQDA